jgi:hypothetical protein
MTAKELIEKLKEFPEDMEVLNYEYFDIHDAYEDTYIDKKYVVIN